MLGNRKQVSWAVGGSVLLHFLFLLLWAVAVQWFPSPPQAASPPPIRLQIVKAEDTPPPPEIPDPPETPTPTPRPFLDTSSRVPSDTPPEVANFESNQDTRAASLLPATGDQPLPSQQGRQRPVFAFDTTHYTPGETPAVAMSAPADTPAPAPSQPTPMPRPARTPVPDDEFGLPAPTPNPDDAAPAFDPAFRSPESTSPPGPKVASRSANQSNAAGFQAENEMTSVSGNIGKHGENSVDAAATPVGRYRSMVIRAITSKWYNYFYSKSDIVSLGTVHIHLVVDQGGRVLTPRVLSNTSNEALAAVCLQAIMDAPIPPMPTETISVMKGGPLSVDLTFNAE